MKIDMSDDIIDLASRRSAKTLAAINQRAMLVVSAAERAAQQQRMPAPDNAPLVYGAGVDTLFSAALFRMPFVALPTEECASWGEFWDRTSMWTDEPTKDASADYHRGLRYAQEAIAAIVAERAIPRGLEMIVEHMMRRAFARRGPAGRLCRQLSSAESAFLQQLCRIAVEAVRQNGMPTLRGG
jgi:hypothetical protein